MARHYAPAGTANRWQTPADIETYDLELMSGCCTIADKELTACVSGLAAALRDRVACDTRTRGNVGMQLLRKMQDAVHVPVMGRYTEAVNWHA